MHILLDYVHNNETMIYECVTGWGVDKRWVMLVLIHLLVSDPFTSSDKSYRQMRAVHSPYM